MKRLEEALHSLESRGPDGGGDWRPWREVRAEAIKLLETIPAEALDPVVPRLREVFFKSSDVEARKVSAQLLVRYSAATSQPELVQRLSRDTSLNYLLFDALRDSVELGVDVWPLVQPLLPAHADRLDQVLGKLVMKTPALLGELEPALAMKTVFQVGLWQGGALAPFANVIIDTYLRETGETKEAAGRGLLMASSQPALLPAGKLEERLATARSDESRLLARVMFHERSKRAEDVESLLTHSQPLVRLGAYEALIRNGVNWGRVLEGLLDSDPQVRAQVLQSAYLNVERGKPLDEELGRRVIATGHEDLHVFISFVATKYPELKKAWLRDLPPSKLRRTFEAKATRACGRCRSLRREMSWNSGHSEPPAVAQLERATNSVLLRCPECWAHFTIDHWEEIDVNSKHEQWTLRRLKFSELLQRPDFDVSHPRVASWPEGVREDLHHIESDVREAANWELPLPMERE